MSRPDSNTAVTRRNLLWTSGADSSPTKNVCWGNICVGHKTHAEETFVSDKKISATNLVALIFYRLSSFLSIKLMPSSSSTKFLFSFIANINASTIRGSNWVPFPFSSSSSALRSVNLGR